MNSADENRALRKQLLVARSNLCRLKMRHEAGNLRASLSLRQAAATVATSRAAGNAAFLLALAGLGQSRMVRLLAFASRTLMVARITGFMVSLLRRPAARPCDSSGSSPAIPTIQ